MNKNKKIGTKLNRSTLSSLEDNNVWAISKIVANATKKAHCDTAEIMGESVEVKDNSIVLVRDGKIVRKIKSLNSRKAKVGDKFTLSY